MQGRNLGCSLSELILYLYRDTLLPELFELLGEELGLEFVQMFGGLRIEVPSYQKVLELERDLDIYESLCYLNSQQTVRNLAQKYSVTEVWIRELYKNMRRKYPTIQRFVEKARSSQPVRVTTRRLPQKDIHEIKERKE